MAFGDLKVQDLIYEDGSNNEITVVLANLVVRDGSGDLVQADNKKFIAGTGSDLQIYHDGNSRIQNTNNSCDFRIQSDGIELKANSVDEMMLKGAKDGAVELYYDGVKKFETTALGISVTGMIQATNTVLVGDSVEFVAGASQDLRLWHNGTDSYLTNATGDLYIQGNGDDILMRAADDITLYTQTSDQAINCIGNGAVELYYDNEKMFQTNGDGAEFFDSDNNFNLYFTCNGTRRGYLFVDSSNGGKMAFMDSQNHPMLEGIKNGAVNLYYDNVKKFETTGSGIQVTGIASSGNVVLGDNVKSLWGDGEDLQIHHNGSDSIINQMTQHNLWIKHDSDGMAAFKADGAVELYYDNSKKFETFSAGVLVGATSQGGHGTTIGQDGVQLTVNFSTTDIRWMQIWESDHGTAEAKAGVQSDGKIMARTTSIQSFSSERRTKKNIVELDKNKAWNTIRDTPFYTFNYKPEPDGSELHHAPIVDELPADMVVPTQASDEVGVINTYNAERLLFRSFSALQQALKKIETLETKVAALEG